MKVSLLKDLDNTIQKTEKKIKKNKNYNNYIEALSMYESLLKRGLISPRGNQLMLPEDKIINAYAYNYVK